MELEKRLRNLNLQDAPLKEQGKWEDEVLREDSEGTENNKERNTTLLAECFRQPILTFEEETALAKNMCSALKSYQNAICSSGLGALRIAQYGRPSISMWQLRRRFNNAAKVMASNEEIVPEIYRIVKETKSLLQGDYNLNNVASRIAKNANRQSDLLQPWISRAITLDKCLAGEGHFPGIKEYAEFFRNMKESHGFNTENLPDCVTAFANSLDRELSTRSNRTNLILSKSEHEQLYLMVAQESGAIPEMLLEFLDSAEGARRDYYANKEEFVLHNVRLVKKIASKIKCNLHHRLENSFLDEDDLWSAGMDGVSTAIERFNPDKGLRLVTYAFQWIEQKIYRLIANNYGAVTLPVHVGERITKAQKAIWHAEQRLNGEDLDWQEISEEIDIEPEKIKELLKKNLPPIHLDAPQSEENPSPFYDMYPDKSHQEMYNSMNTGQLRENIESALHTLTDKERNIVELRFGFVNSHSYTLEEVGEMYGCTSERIRQIESKALRKLRHPSRMKLLDTPKMSLSE